MNVEQFANYFRILGHHVVETKSAYWYNVNQRAFNSIPFHRLLQPTPDEFSALWRSGGALVARYPTHADSQVGQASYMFVCRNKNYDLEQFSANTRSHTRRGLKNCEIRRIEFDFLAKEGLALHVSTLNRQGYTIPTTVTERWQRTCAAAAQTPDFEAWGAFIDNQLAALAVGFLIENCYQVSTVRSQKELLKHYPNNALIYHVTHTAINRPEVDFVSYGVESLNDSLEGLVKFKVDMGYELMTIKQHAIFHPWLRPLVRGSRSLILRVAEARPANLTLQKIKGLVRFATA